LQTVECAGTLPPKKFLLLFEVRITCPVNEVVHTQYQRTVRGVQTTSGLAEP